MAGIRGRGGRNVADNITDELEVDHGLLIQWVNEAEDATDDSRALSEKCRDYYDSKQWTDPEIKKLKTEKFFRCALLGPNRMDGFRRSSGTLSRRRRPS